MPIGLIHVLGPVHGHQEVLTRLHTQPRVHCGRLDLGGVTLENFKDRIADYEDTVVVDALSEQVFLAAVGVGHEDGAAMVDDAPVHLFWHPVVVAAVARFHVVDRDAHPFGQDGEAAVRVAQNQEPIGLPGAIPFRCCQNLPNLLAKLLTRTPRNKSGGRTQLSEEDITEVGIEVLASVHQPVVAQADRAAQ